MTTQMTTTTARRRSDEEEEWSRRMQMVTATTVGTAMVKTIYTLLSTALCLKRDAAINAFSPQTIRWCQRIELQNETLLSTA